jgi:hypothetical protein
MSNPPASTKSRVLISLSPTIAFLVVNYGLGLTEAMIAATLTSALVIGSRWLKGRRIGILLPASLAYVAIRGLAGALTGSEDVYFGIGVVLSATTAVAIGATAFTLTPAASYFIPLVVTYRQQTVNHALYMRVAAQLTVAWALMELAISGWEAWHLTRVTATEFIFLRTFVGWPVMAIWIFFLVFYLRLRLDPLQHALAGDVPARWGKGPNRSGQA